MEGYTVLSVAIYFFFYISVLVFLILWICLVVFRRRQFATSGNSPSRPYVAAPPSLHQGRGGGLDMAAIDATLPSFTFSHKLKSGVVGSSSIKLDDHNNQCAVCLGTFKEGETLRLVPGCWHVFHAQCVDLWLCRQATCPYCRSKVVVVVPAQSREESPAVRITLWDAVVAPRSLS